MCRKKQRLTEETWINSDIEKAFLELADRGMAHSVECWRDGELVGGLYGLAMGCAFFGESMFSRATDASKVALVWLVARLQVGGFTLLDCQFMTDHLRSLGAIEISQQHYLELLDVALGRVKPPQFSSVASPSPESGASSAAGAEAAGNPRWRLGCARWLAGRFVTRFCVFDRGFFARKAHPAFFDPDVIDRVLNNVC